MRTLAVVSGAAAGSVERPRAAWFLARLGGLGAVDLVVIHEPSSAVAGRDRLQAELEAAGAVDRAVAVVAAPPPRTGLLREVHLHGRGGPPPRTAAALVVDSFVRSAPAAHDLLWCSDVVAMARVRSSFRALPSVVDVDDTVDLGSARARRSARLWAAAAHLVTVPDAARREELGVPGSLVVPADGAPAELGATDRFATAVTEVVGQAAAYRPVRST